MAGSQPKALCNQVRPFPLYFTPLWPHPWVKGIIFRRSPLLMDTQRGNSSTTLQSEYIREH